MQAVALAVIVIVLLEFCQYKRIGLRSTKLFAGFLCLSAVNVLMELLTLYTIWNIDVVGTGWNRFSHQLFIGSLDAAILCLFLYVDIKSRRQKRYTEEQLLCRLLPALVALGVIVCGKIDYYMGDTVRYAYGSVAMTVYFSVGIYMIWILRVLRKTEGVFDTKEKWSMRVGIGVWIVMAVIQLLAPESLLSSMGLVMMVVFLYIAFENPQIYQDAELPDMMNEYAFTEAVSALLEMRASFQILEIHAANPEEVYHSYGKEEIQRELAAVGEAMCVTKRQCVYHVSDYSVCLIYDKEKRYRKGMEKVQVFLEQQRESAREKTIKYDFWHIPVPEFGHTQEELSQIIDYCRECGISAGNELMHMNREILEEVYRKEALVKLVEKAVSEELLEVYYQPIYATKERGFLSAEALVRLRDRETLGYISPEIFIPIAEEKGWIEKLGMQVFEQVCRFASREKLWNYGVEYLEVNLSGIQASNPELPGLLMSCADKYGIRPGFLNLEITETAEVEYGAQVRENMSALKELGFHFSMDDFGTGYSNLSTMAESQFDLIKLDKSLIWPCFGDDKEKPEVILEASIMMIHRLGLKIVAEGIETAEQQRFLEERGVEYLQGYLFSRPVSAERYIEFLHVEHIKGMME